MHNIKIVLVVNKLERELITMKKLKLALEKLNRHSQILIIHWLDNEFISKVLEFKPLIVLTFPLTAKQLSHRFYILKYLLNFTLVRFA
ncbi:hypothetical protein MHK_004784, partial [Candidatus Magnetomorum sp. HK-1]